MKHLIHQRLLQKRDTVRDWFRNERRGRILPIYTSVDVRDAGFKVASVDANIYPAGFNNICPTDKERAPEILRAYLDTRYGSKVKNVVLLTEEHTNNPYYWDNVLSLMKMFEEAGRQVRITIPRQLNRLVQVRSASGVMVSVHPTFVEEGRLVTTDGYSADLVVSNNDFSDPRLEWAQGLETPMNPARELGWYQRRKSRHFEFYNDYAEQLAKLLDLDPWLFQVRTTVFPNFDSSDEVRLKELAKTVDKELFILHEHHKENKIDRKPVVFVKNNSGTYGLAVTSVHSGAEILDWNSKSRKKMEAAKGGKQVQELIIQEGIPSILQSDGETAEPTIYMVGCDLIGGFLRAHKEKGPDESLNSPGAVFKRLCVSDLEVKIEGAPLENVYGTIARLGSLAIGREIEAMHVQFRDYEATNC